MKIQATTIDAYQLFHDGQLALAEASRNGMRVDVEYCQEKSKELTREIKKLKGEFAKTKLGKFWKKEYPTSFKFTSDLQLRKILYDKMNLSTDKETQKGKQATSEEALLELSIPELETRIKICQLQKMKSTYIDGLIRETVDGFVHPMYGLNLPVSYRSSSQLPNFQNQPNRNPEFKKMIRQAIYSRKGHQILGVDFSGIEVCIAACYHKDLNMIKYITDPKSDMHGDMAKQIYKLKSLDKSIPGHSHLRYCAKNGFVFPQFYGDWHQTCAKRLISLAKGTELNDMFTIYEHLESKGLIKLKKNGEVKSYDKFEKHIKEIEDHFWNNRFPIYGKWKRRHYARYQKKGYVDLFTGFRCSGNMSRNESINYPIQGAAFHCLLWSFNKIHEILYRKRMQSRLVGQIHDEMILDVHPSELKLVLKIIKVVTCEMLPEHWKWINVPLGVDAQVSPINGSWAEMEDVRI